MLGQPSQDQQELLQLCCCLKLYPFYTTAIGGNCTQHSAALQASQAQQPRASWARRQLRSPRHLRVHRIPAWQVAPLQTLEESRGLLLLRIPLPSSGMLARAANIPQEGTHSPLRGSTQAISFELESGWVVRSYHIGGLFNFSWAFE